MFAGGVMSHQASAKRQRLCGVGSMVREIGGMRDQRGFSASTFTVREIPSLLQLSMSSFSQANRSSDEFPCFTPKKLPPFCSLNDCRSRRSLRV
jgi:hypothetical protein